jgi:two-component system LytT family response regulator
VLIVDDEPLIRLGIRRAVDAAPGFEVAGECELGDDAVAAIEAQPPDIVLLDVQMPDCSGLEVIRRVGPERMPAVIFVTAYDQYAVQAFAVNAIDYVLKPFDPDRLQQALERARTRLSADRGPLLAERLQALLRSGPDETRPERLVVRSGERFELVPVETIDWIESADNYVQLHCGTRQHLLSETLTNLERRLDPRCFLRVHRSRIVNTSRVIAVHVLVGGTYALQLRDGTRVRSGRLYRDAVQQLIRG